MTRSEQEARQFFEKVRKQIRRMPEVDTIVDEETEEQNAQIVKGRDPGGMSIKNFHVTVSDKFKEQLSAGEHASVKMESRLTDRTSIPDMIVQDMQGTSDGLGPKQYGAKGGINTLDRRDGKPGDLTLYVYFMVHKGL